jgi:hypothetical protein
MILSAAALVLPLRTAPTTTAAAPATAEAPGTTAYGPDFFATAQLNTAYDMIMRLPGFTFDPGPTVRGYAGAAGNVLINGQRPSAKTDILTDILKRLPASSVERIDVIRGGAPGIDMQGRTILANVIVKTGARTEVTAEAALHVYGDGRMAPEAEIDIARRSGDRSLAGSIRYFNQDGGDEGAGIKRRQDGTGAPIWAADANRVDQDEGVRLRGSDQQPLAKGLLHINGALDVITSTHLEQDRATFSTNGEGSEAFSEIYRYQVGEVGGDFTRQFGSHTKLTLVALQSVTNLGFQSQADQNLALSDFTQHQLSGESILRGTVSLSRWRDLDLEAGAEGVFNFLDSRSNFTQSGVTIALPNARVLVDERRGEAFATATWRIDPKLTLETGMRVEASIISQKGDTRSSESFFFPKPRALLTWSPSSDFQIRLRLEREVGQLDFTNFAAAATLSTGTVNAGNAHLQPERRWVVEAAFDQRFWGDGEAVLTLTHQALEEVIDVVPVAGLNAPGNIGNGRRDVVEFALTAPLAKLGMRGGLLKADGKWIFSRVTDPTTGLPRMISWDQMSTDYPFLGSIVLTNDVPKLKSTWTATLTSAFRAPVYRIDEVLTYRDSAELDLVWEYKPSQGLSIQAEAGNVLGQTRARFSTLFTGPRNNSPVSMFEQLAVRFPAFFYLRVRKAW